MISRIKAVFMFQNTNKLLKEFFEQDCPRLSIILLIVAVFISPMIFLGIPDGNIDFPTHLQFAAAYHDAILNGDFLPTWAGSDNLGFGSIGIRFYPPISSLSLALIKMITGNWLDAFLVIFFFWMFAGCVGIYYWSREWLSRRNSTIAAVLYIIVPYHLTQIYQMWLFAEFVACAIIPFCFLFITRICRRGRTTDILLFAVSFSLLILSHIPSTIIGSISLAIYAFFLMDWTEWRNTFLKLFAAAITSLSATAFYWVKVVTEINLGKANSPQFSSGYYDPQNHLFPLFVRAGNRYVERVSWIFDLSILLTILIFLPAVFYLVIKIKKNEHKDKKAVLALSATGLLSFFMMSLPSSFVWSLLPTLHKIQFPWRWLAILSAISVLTFGFAISKLASESTRVKKISAYSILLIFSSVLLFDITQNIIQSEPLPRAIFEAKLPKMFSMPGCDCWWTTWARGEAFNHTEKILADSRDVQISKWENKTREFTIEIGQPTDVRVATFYYPYWQAQVNGQAVQVKKDNDGSILIPISSEKSSIKLYFQEPNFLKFSLVLSLSTWLFLIISVILFCRKEGILNFFGSNENI